MPLNALKNKWKDETIRKVDKLLLAGRCVTDTIEICDKFNTHSIHSNEQ